MSVPATTMRPAIGGKRPAMLRIRVVFPAPLAPRSAVIRPFGASSETPCRMRTCPYPASRLLISSIAMTAKIDARYLRLLGDDLRRTLCYSLPEMQYDDPIGKRHQGAHHMLDNDQG